MCIIVSVIFPCIIFYLQIFSNGGFPACNVGWRILSHEPCGNINPLQYSNWRLMRIVYFQGLENVFNYAESRSFEMFSFFWKGSMSGCIFFFQFWNWCRRHEISCYNILFLCCPVFWDILPCPFSTLKKLVIIALLHWLYLNFNCRSNRALINSSLE